MDLKKPLELEIAYYTEESYGLQEMGIKQELEEEYFLKTFYSIDVIGDDGDRATVVVGGELFVCSLDYKTLKQLIEEHR